MSAKVTIALSDEEHRFFQELIESGRYPSLSAIVSEGLALMRRDDEQALEDAVISIADEIRRRMELPPDQRLAWDSKAMAETLSARLTEKYRQPDGHIDNDPVAAMANEIQRRMQLPRDQLMSMKDDDLFDRVRAVIDERRSK